jgi:hypothetical protein
MTDEFQTADVIALNDKQLERKLKACLYKKLQQARVDFKEKHIEARGRNDFNKFDYITLKDIVLEAIPILQANNLSIHHKFYLSPPRVELVDLETGYSEDFGSNVDFPVDGKNTNQRLQSLGSTESYIRRYIYLQILDIVESDPDRDFGKPEPKKPNGRYKEKGMGNMTSGKKVDNNISDDRVHDLARQLGEELGEQGVDNPTNRNKLELANQWFTEKRINNHELRALRKLLGAVKP